MSKAIYQPDGRAKEYSRWACNLHVGCDNACSYCFNKRGVLSTTLGGNVAHLKKCFKDDEDAYLSFVSELSRQKDDIIRNGGLLFSFTTDPCLPTTLGLTFRCIAYATAWKVPCLVLTKRTDWILDSPGMSVIPRTANGILAVGFTLTGRDDLEPCASPNGDRIEAMRLLKEAGFRTFASIEPVIEFEKSLEMIRRSAPWCDHYKVGLISGNRHAYDKYRMPDDLEAFVGEVNQIAGQYGKTVYWKKSVTQVLGHEVAAPCSVDAGYDIFNQQD